MSYAHPIRDIRPKSIWLDAAGERVTIAQAAEGYVGYLRVGALTVMHERDFRGQYAPIYERQALRSQFQMSIANLGNFNVYWIPSERGIRARSIGCSRKFSLPADALLVGVYSGPCSSEQFFDDLDEAIRRSDHATRAHAIA